MPLTDPSPPSAGTSVSRQDGVLFVTDSSAVLTSVAATVRFPTWRAVSDKFSVCKASSDTFKDPDKRLFFSLLTFLSIQRLRP